MQQERAQILFDISNALEKLSDSNKVYKALFHCRDHRITYADAHNPEFKIGSKIVKMTKDSASCPSAVALGKRIVNDWMLEKKNAAS